MSKLLCVLLSALVAISTALKLPADFVEYKGRIVAGEVANVDQFPHVVSLRSIIGNNHFCAGALISNRWVLSVAHCTRERHRDNCQIAAGSNLRTGGTLFAVEQIINHESYNHTTMEADISLIQSRTVIAGTHVLHRALTGGFVSNAIAGVIAGWGVTHTPDGSESLELRFLNQVTTTNADCILRMAGLGPEILAGNICAIGSQLHEGSGTCMGDDGGPLSSDTAQQTIFGVLSWGVACGRGFPDVYTRVSTYRVWITANSGV